MYHTGLQNNKESEKIKNYFPFLGIMRNLKIREIATMNYFECFLACPSISRYFGPLF
jgi:hypothetical protein